MTDKPTGLTELQEIRRYFPAHTLQHHADINMNDRICQFRIINTQPGVKFEVCEVLGNKDREGFGSTGTK